MHYYTHNIKTFNNATQHLTHVERSLYRCLIEYYYDTEQPLPADNFNQLARRVMARTDDEKEALKLVLGEFFELTGDVYTHDFCDEVIEAYRNTKSAKSRAGKASAEARRKKAEERKKKRREEKEQKLTDDQQVLNPVATEAQQNPTNQKPKTKNQFTSEEKTSDPVDGRSADPDDISLAKRMFELIQIVAPKSRQPDFGKWADTIRLMRERDGHTADEIEKTFIWANNNNFWKSNILSPVKLREKFSMLDAQIRNHRAPIGDLEDRPLWN